MNFVRRLHMFIGMNVEIAVSNGHIITGVLLEVNPNFVIVLVVSVPGYDGGEGEVVIRTERIDYVRVS